MLRLVLCALCFALSSAQATDLDPVTAAEIDHLRAFIKASPCAFNRNGTWYHAAEAALHIDKKYHYVRDKGLIDSAEDFIRYAASESSFSGRDYRVRCVVSELSSAEWLHNALRCYRGRRVSP